MGGNGTREHRKHVTAKRCATSAEQKPSREAVARGALSDEGPRQATRVKGLECPEMVWYGRMPLQMGTSQVTTVTLVP